MKTIKYLFVILIAAVTFSLTSCCTTMYAEDEMYNTEYVSDGVTYSTIITYGTPFYYNNAISYYLYNGWYYYPYMWNGYWYFYPYRHIRPAGFVYRPHWGHRPIGGLCDRDNRHPHNFGNHQNYGDGKHRPGIQRGNKPSQHKGQPNIQRQGRESSTRATVPQTYRRQSGPSINRGTTSGSFRNSGTRGGSTRSGGSGSCGGNSHGGRR